MIRGFSIKKSQTDEGERPFWISYADLMTSLMILFLVVMLVSIVALTKSVQSVAEINEENRKQALELRKIRQEQAKLNETKQEVVRSLSEVAKKHGLRFRNKDTIDFGSKARFAQNSHELSPRQQQTIRDLAPDLIQVANSREGLLTIRRIIVEGFASPEGSYLLNLDLSEKRSQRVMCALLDPEPRNSEEIRALFATAGASSTSLKKTREASRRIEMRIEFLDLDEFKRKSKGNLLERRGVGGRVGECALK